MKVKFVVSYTWLTYIFMVPRYKMINAFNIKADKQRMKANYIFLGEEEI